MFHPSVEISIIVIIYHFSCCNVDMSLILFRFVSFARYLIAQTAGALLQAIWTRRSKHAWHCKQLGSPALRNGSCGRSFRNSRANCCGHGQDLYHFSLWYCVFIYFALFSVPHVSNTTLYTHTHTHTNAAAHHTTSHHLHIIVLS